MVNLSSKLMLFFLLFPVIGIYVLAVSAVISFSNTNHIVSHFPCEPGSSSYRQHRQISYRPITAITGCMAQRHSSLFLAHLSVHSPGGET